MERVYRGLRRWTLPAWMLLCALLLAVPGRAMAQAPPAATTTSPPPACSARRPRSLTGTTNGATAEVNEPFHVTGITPNTRSGSATTHPPRARRRLIDCDTHFSAVLAVYTGTTLADLHQVANQRYECDDPLDLHRDRRHDVLDRARQPLQRRDRHATRSGSTRRPTTTTGATPTTSESSDDPRGQHARRDQGDGRACPRRRPRRALRVVPVLRRAQRSRSSWTPATPASTRCSPSTAPAPTAASPPATTARAAVRTATARVLRFTPPDDDEYYYVALDGKGGASGAYALDTSATTPRAALTSSTRTTGSRRATASRRRERGDGQFGRYRIYDLVPGQRFAVDTCKTGVGGLDTVVGVYDEDGNSLGSNDDALGCGAERHGQRGPCHRHRRRPLGRGGRQDGATGQFTIRWRPRPETT